MAHTLYFADRPAQEAGVVPTAVFLDALGAAEDMPPNAALVGEAAAGVAADTGGMIWILTLLRGTYDAAAEVLSYDVRVVGPEALTPATSRFVVMPAAAPPAVQDVGPGHLFIDPLEHVITIINLNHATQRISIIKVPPREE